MGMICITGTPGVGKTAVAKILSEMMNLPYTNLNDFLRENLPHERDEKRRSDVFDETKLEGIRIEGIVDGHLSHFCNCDAIIVLRCSNQKIHVERMRKKGFWEEKIRENMEAELMEVIAEEAREISARKNIPILEIDTSSKTPEEIAGIISKWLMLQGFV